MFFKDLEGKIENFQKMSISGPDLRSKNRLALMALYTMAFVIKLSKRCEIFFENRDEYFGKLTFCVFHIFLCRAHKMKFFEKKNSNYFFLEKMLNFISITCVDEYKNEGSGRC